MGEIAEYLLNGDDCEQCGMPFDDDGDGFPRVCEACSPPARKVVHRHKGQQPRPPGTQHVFNPPYPNKTAKNRAKKARRRARAEAAGSIAP